MQRIIFLNYYSRELLEELDRQELIKDRFNSYLINYNKIPKNIKEEKIQGMLSRQKDIKMQFVSFINYQDYVYHNKEDFWDLEESKNAILWEKFLSKETLKSLPTSFDCSLEEKLLYSKDTELNNVLNSHRILNA